MRWYQKSERFHQCLARFSALLACIQFVTTTTTVGCPDTLKLKPVTPKLKSKSKSSNMAPTLANKSLTLHAHKHLCRFPHEWLSYRTGISLIRNSEVVFTAAPSGKVPRALMLTVLPPPGRMTYLLPEALLNPSAEADTLLSGIPGMEIVIGLSTPRYTTFILSAEITAELGLVMVANVALTGFQCLYHFQ